MLKYICLIVLCATTAIAQPIGDRRNISVDGEAEVSAQPDRAYITLGVESEGPVASAVKDANDKAASSLLKAMRGIGIDDRDVQTTDVTLTPVYNYKQDGKREFLKYQMRNTIRVTVREMSKLDAVLKASVMSGGNIIDDIGFGVSNERALRDSARVLAAKDALVKATDLASAIGTRLGKPLSIQAQDANYPVMPMYKMRADAVGGAESTVSAGQFRFRVVVHAMFEIE